MRTVLVNLPWTVNGRLGVRAGSRWPFTSLPERDGRIHYIPFPFFLAYASAVLKQAGKPVQLIDAIAQGMDERSCLEEIRAFQPGLVVVETSAPSFGNDIRIIKDLRAKMPGVQIGLCGPYHGDMAVEILDGNPSVDFFLIGEYEYTLLEMVERLDGGTGLQMVKGLAHRSGGKVVVNEPRPFLKNLDDLPWPDRSEHCVYQYNDAFAGLPVPNVQMWSSRGCPFMCNFCLWPQTIYKGGCYRKRKASDVVDEMEYLLARFAVKAVYFDDDIFNADRRHVLDICNEIIRRKISVPWAMMARVDLMDDVLLKALALAGLYAVKYGIESADDTVQRLCGKGLDIEAARAVIKKTRDLGIKVHLTFCIGLPGETRQTLQKTIDFVREVTPDSMQFSFATPFPGTEYYQEAVNKGWLVSTDLNDYDGQRRCVIRNADLGPEDLERVMTEFGIVQKHS